MTKPIQYPSSFPSIPIANRPDLCGLCSGGHNPHHIQANLSYDRPKSDVTATVDDDGWITITFPDGTVERTWNHRPDWVAALLARTGGVCDRRSPGLLLIKSSCVHLGTGPTPCVPRREIWAE